MSVHRAMAVTFDGIDGSGKTSLAQSTATLLRESEIPTRVLNQWSGYFGSEKIKGFFCNPNLNHTARVLALYLARIQFCETILRPALAEPGIIILDRWTLSTYVYQKVVEPGILKPIDWQTLDSLLYRSSPHVLIDFEPIQYFIYRDPHKCMESLMDKANADGMDREQNLDRLFYLSNTFHKETLNGRAILFDNNHYPLEVNAQTMHQDLLQHYSTHLDRIQENV